MRKVNTDLIAAIEETLEVQEEGRIKSRQAETELVELEEEFKAKLRNVTD